MIHINKKTYLTTGEIGKILHVTRVTVYRWIRLGQLKAVRVHKGKYRVAKNDFAEFIKQHDLHNQVDSEIIAAPTLKILIVNDEPRIIKTLKTFLEKANPHYHILGATNGFDAGKLLVSFNPDIVILYLIMPGIDGFEICKHIKSDPHTKHIAVIAITGPAPEKNMNQMRKAGADGIFIKPPDYKKLWTSIEKLAK